MIISVLMIWLNVDSVILGGLMITAATLYTVMRVLLIFFGDDLQKKRSIMKLRVSDANIDFVFGVNSDSLVLGRKLAGIKGNMQVYIDGIINKDYKEFSTRSRSNCMLRHNRTRCLCIVPTKHQRSEKEKKSQALCSVK